MPAHPNITTSPISVRMISRAIANSSRNRVQQIKDNENVFLRRTVDGLPPATAPTSFPSTCSSKSLLLDDNLASPSDSRSTIELVPASLTILARTASAGGSAKVVDTMRSSRDEESRKSIAEFSDVTCCCCGAPSALDTPSAPLVSVSVERSLLGSKAVSLFTSLANSPMVLRSASRLFRARAAACSRTRACTSGVREANGIWEEAVPDWWSPLFVAP